MDAQILFERLLRSETEAEVDAALSAAGYLLGNKSVWQPLGGMENNFSTVGNQQTEATAAFSREDYQWDRCYTDGPILLRKY